jgi:predicted dehydrogenase
MISRVAIIGSGFGMYGLLPSFSNIAGCNVVSISGKNSDRMERYCKKYGLNQYADWKEMLYKENPNAVAIAVIPKHQYEIAKYALDNNIAVFAEKPLTTSFETSFELTALAKKKSLPNVVDFIFPEIPVWKEAKKLLDDKLLGKIISVNVDWKFLSYDLRNGIKSWKTDVEQGGGALSFYFSHAFYYLEYFLGRIKNIRCTFSSFKKNLNECETGINMTLLFENGCIGKANLYISYIGQQKHVVEFIGEKGSLKLQNNSDNFVDNFELISTRLDKTQKIVPDPVFTLSCDKSEDYRVRVIMPIAERFINWCNNGIKTKPDFQDGLRVQELIEMARSTG